MTARYTDAEKAAAKRIGYAPVLRGEAPDAAWLVMFRECVAGGLNYLARYHRVRAARIRREAEKQAARVDVLVARAVSDADDARLVARGVAREQRKAARS